MTLGIRSAILLCALGVGGGCGDGSEASGDEPSRQRDGGRPDAGRGRDARDGGVRRGDGGEDASAAIDGGYDARSEKPTPAVGVWELPLVVQPRCGDQGMGPQPDAYENEAIEGLMLLAFEPLA